MCGGGEGCVQYISHECVCVWGEVVYSVACTCVWGGGGCVQYISYKPVYSILAMSLCVWGGGSCIHYISYKPVCVCWGGGEEVVYSMHTLHIGVVPLGISLCVCGGGGAMYSILGISLHVHTCRR